MQSKGFIKLIAVLLALACVYQLSFTFKTRGVEKQAAAYAAQFPLDQQGEAEQHYLDSVQNLPVYNLGFRKFTYKECKEKELNLGLDLKGGMNVMLEVQVEDVVKALAGDSQNDPAFIEAIGVANEAMKQGSSTDYISDFVKAYSRLSNGRPIAELFVSPDRKDITLESSDADVEKILKKETEAAIGASFNVLRSRIDHFGVTQPNILRLPNSHRILVELPGVKEPQRVRDLLQGTASLEFWTTYDANEIFPALSAADKLIKAELAQAPAAAPETVPAATEAVPEPSDHLAAMMRRSARREEAYVPTSQLRRFTLPDSAPIMRRVMGFLSDQARTLIHAGVSRDRICIDPGPGFGKTANEDIVIQRETAKMASLGYPLMCAVSRKRFVGAVSGVTEAAARDAVTFGVCLGAIQAGANIVRVHDVAGFAQFLNGYWAVAEPQPRRAFVAVGSNLGHRCDNIRAARNMIAEIPLTCVSNCSRIYESEPAYETRQDTFANAVIEIKTELAPLVLLDELMKIEAELGRDRSKKAKANGPRTIDLDLLWMDGEIHGGKKLRLPHPLIGERDFVLVPLEDLMHDPARFFRYNGVEVKEPEDRVGHIVGELGRM